MKIVVLPYGEGVEWSRVGKCMKGRTGLIVHVCGKTVCWTMVLVEKEMVLGARSLRTGGACM